MEKVCEFCGCEAEEDNICNSCLEIELQDYEAFSETKNSLDLYHR